MTIKSRETLAAYLFLLPFLILLAIFFAYAAVRALIFSFTNYDLFSTPEFVGFRNYINLFADVNFLTALRNSIVFSIVVTATQTFGALVMATVLNNRLRGIGFFRAAYYMPAITSSVVITLIFMWLFQRRGLINFLSTQFLAYLPQLLVFLALALILHVLQVAWERRRGYPAEWLDPALAVVSILVAGGATGVLTFAGIVAPRDIPQVDMIWLQTSQAVPEGMPFWLSAPVPLVTIMIMNVFTTVPTFMLMFLAALQDVPKSLYEAASLDGASPVQQFFNITIPSVQPITFLVVTLSMIGTLQMFDQVAILGDAAPFRSTVTLAYFVYDRMFPGGQSPEVGFAAASAMFLALFTLVVVLVQRRFIASEAG